MISSFTSLLGRLLLLALLLLASRTVDAATAPTLGNAESFAVFGAVGVSNTGTTVVTGDLGIAPGLAVSVTGFPPGIVVGGMIFAGAVIPDPTAAAAQLDAGAAFTALDQPCTQTFIAPTDLGGMTLVPGVYCFGSTAGLTGTLTLNAGGDPNAVWIFKVGSSITTATDSIVRLINGAQECNVFWRVVESATLQTRTRFVGTVIASTSITMVTEASIAGRVIALNGAVTLDTNSATAVVCAEALPGTPPTLAKAFSAATIDAGGTSTLTITLSNPNSTAATLSAALVDTLPAGVVIAATPNANTTCGGGSSVGATAGGGTVTLAAGRSIPAASGAMPGTCTVTVDVTAAASGSYLNTLIVGALQTSNGSNTVPAIATLTVNPPVGAGAPPTVGKEFSPSAITVGGVATLTITLSNPDDTGIATLSVPLIDTLPSGMVIADPPNAGTTCGGGTMVIAVAGGDMVTLPAGSTIPAAAGGVAGSCTVTVDVTATVVGLYINTLGVDVLVTDNGGNEAPVVTSLIVNPIVASVPTAPAPVLSARAVIVAILALAFVAFVAIRSRRLDIS